MRSKKQLAQRQRRRDIANQILAWFKDQGISGANRVNTYIHEFAKTKSYEVYECWAAWDMLHNAGRVKSGPGPGFKILNFTPVELDDNGDLKRES